ncbi:hypothetical protein [Streptomyces sp. NPDC005017]|uniref:hypothetical protein n=1 Tax=Streptomyces sp. NPDC005017 TaxID=3364706 RepID=UPI003680989C
MSGTGGDGTDGPEIGSVRFNDRGQVEFYDGEVWMLYPDLTTGEEEARALVRGADPADADGGGLTDRDRDSDGPEPR